MEQYGGSGINTNGQLGQGNNTASTRIVRVKTDSNTYLENVKKISASYYHVVALTNDGKVYSWGYNGTGVLGVGDTGERYYATPVIDSNNRELTDVIDIATSKLTTVYVKRDGGIYVSGENKNNVYAGYAPANATKANFVMNKGAIKADTGFENVAMMTDNGTTYTWGYNGGSRAPSNGFYNMGKDYVDVQISVSQEMFLDENGELWVAGTNKNGLFGNGTATNSASLIQPTTIPEGAKIKYISLSEYDSKILTADGKVYGSGTNTSGQLGQGNWDNTYSYLSYKLDEDTELTDAILLSSTGRGDPILEYAVIRADGTVWATGDNSKCQFGDLTYDSTAYLTKIGESIIKLNTVNRDIKVGETYDINVIDANEFMAYIAEPVDQTTWRWESLDPSIASVNANTGVVTGVSMGTTTIFGTGPNGYKAQAVINVYNANAKNKSKIVAGSNYFVALKQDGTVWTWGNNGNGQLGQGDTGNRWEPTQVKINEEYVTDAIDVAAGANHTMILRSDGSVWACGNGADYRLGDGTNVQKTYFVRVKNSDEEGDYVRNVIAIAAGSGSSYLLKADGTVWAYGLNASGQLGAGHTSVLAYPEQMLYMTNAVAVSAGYNHAVVLGADGRVWGTGLNTNGQLGLGDKTNRTVLDRMYDTDEKYLTNVSEICASGHHTIILKKDGTAYSTGYNNVGQLGDGTTNVKTIIGPILKDENVPVTGVTHLVSGGYSTYLIKKTTGMYTIGANKHAQLFTRSDGNRAYAEEVDVEGKKIFCAAVTKLDNYNQTGAVVDTDGMVYTVGYNAEGQMGNGTSETLWDPWCISNKQLQAEPEIINLKNSGDKQKIECRGVLGFNLLKDSLGDLTYIYESVDTSVAKMNDNQGNVEAVGLGTTFVRIYNAQNDIYTTVRVNVNGEYGSVQPKIVAGLNHFVALKADGTVWVWGGNEKGELGLGDNYNRTEPTQVEINEEYVTDAIDVAAGNEYTLILRKDGSVWATGYNSDYQLGDGTNVAKNRFIRVRASGEDNDYLTDVVDIETTATSSYAIKKDGGVWAWGYNRYGQLGMGHTSTLGYPERMNKVENIVQISGGENFIVMVAADGSVCGTGLNTSGQLGIWNANNQIWPQQMLDADGEILRGVKEVATNNASTFILKEDGTVWATGQNNYGQFGNGTADSTNSIVQVQKQTAVDDEGEVTGYEPVTDAKHIYASGFELYILKKTNGMYVTGFNGRATLFTRDTVNRYYATEVETEKSLLTVGSTRNISGNQTAAIVDTDGMVYTVGHNEQGQMANGTVENLTDPWCISNVKIEINPDVINYKNVGENSHTIVPTIGMTFNLLKDNLVNQNFEFQSMDSNIATVSANGQVTATGIGTTYIRVHNVQNDRYSKVKVNVNGAVGQTQPKIVGGLNHFVALKSDGTVWVWGGNEKGELGLGDHNYRTEPTKVNVKNIVDIAAGNEYTLLLKKDGTVWASGYNGNYELGDGTKVESQTFHKVRANDIGDYLEDVIAITACQNSCFALKSDGSVWAWGYNYYGQLGQKHTSTLVYPTRMQKVSNIVQIIGGDQNVIMLDADGSVWCCGANTNGSFGLGNATTQNLPQQMLDVDGSVLYGVKEIAVGHQHTVILKENGEVWSVGANQYGQLGDGSSTNRNMIVPVQKIIETLVDGTEVTEQIKDAKHIYASAYETYIQKQDKGMYVLGYNNRGSLFTNDTENRYYGEEVQTDKEILVIGCTKNISGCQTSAISDINGMVYTVGYNEQGQIGNGTIENLTSPWCISNVKVNVTPKVINYKNIGDNDKTIESAMAMDFNLIKDELENQDFSYTSYDNSIAEVDENGKVTAKGIGYTYIKVYNSEHDMYSAVKVNVNGAEGKNRPKIVGGLNHVIALKANGTVWAWGGNEYGELGLGDNYYRAEPIQIRINGQRITEAVDIAAGNEFTLILMSDGTVWSSGYNGHYELGDGTTSTAYTFRRVQIDDEGTPLRDIIAVSACQNSCYALMKDGTVWAWGYNYYGQLGQKNTSTLAYPTRMQKVSNIIQIEAGDHNIKMLDADGSVWCCGANTNGSFGIDSTATQNLPQQMLDADGEILYGVKEIASGHQHTVILKENGEVWSVGVNQYGQLGDGTHTQRSLIVPTKKIKETLIDGTIVSERVTDVKHVYASAYATFIQKKDKGMYVLGYNPQGTLFTNDTVNRDYATEVLTDKELIVIAQTKDIGAKPAGAVADINGLVYTVGCNEKGQLANQTTESTELPWCISNIRVELNKQTINYQNIGDNYEKIVPHLSMDFNILRDSFGDESYEFTTTEEKIATISDNGTVTATGIGSTFVKAHNKEYDLYAATKVNVQGDEGSTFPKLSTGANFTVALKANGEVWAWGQNNYGQLGLGDNSNRNEPTQTWINDAIDVSAGDNFTLVLRKDGTVWSSGYNGHGELSQGDRTNRNEFTQVMLDEDNYLTGIKSIVAGYTSGYALTEDGHVYGWGYNYYSQMGIQASGDRYYPVQMLKVSNIIQIAAGDCSVYMLDASGNVWGCGLNNQGQLGLGDTGTRNLPQKMYNTEGTDFLSGIKKIAAGKYHTLMLKDDGTVLSVGLNDDGELGIGSTAKKYLPQVVLQKPSDDDEGDVPVTNIKDIYADGYVSYLIENDKIVKNEQNEDVTESGMYVMGKNNFGQLFIDDGTTRYYATKILQNQGIIAVAATNNVSNETGVYANTDGFVYTVGYNKTGELGDGTYENKWEKVCISEVNLITNPSVINYKAIGDTGEKIATKETSTFNLLYTTIRNSDCKFKSLDEDIATVNEQGVVTATGIGSTFVRVYDENNNAYAGVRVNVNDTQGSTFPKIVGGNNHYVALRANGEVWVWGYNGYGQLGLGDTSNRLEPTQTWIDDAIDIAAGNQYTLVLRKDGTVWATGYNGHGELSQGDRQNRSDFVQVKLDNVEKLTGIVAIAGSDNSGYALTADGNVYGWGYNYYGQLGIQSSGDRYYPVQMQKVSNIIQMSAGDCNLIMLDANGSVWGVGYNGQGAFGIGNTTGQNLPQRMLNESGDDYITGVKKIATGRYHTVLLKEDGTVSTVGYNNEGQLALGDKTRRTIPTVVTFEKAHENDDDIIMDNIKDISAYGYCSYFVRKEDNGEAGMYVAGYSKFGQIFTENTTSRVYPRKVQEDTEILTTAMTRNPTNQTGAIADLNGFVYTVGYNGNGEIGNKTRINSITPVSISDQALIVEKQRVLLNLISNTQEQIKASTDIGFNLLYDTVENEELEFKSLDESIATVDSNGVVTAVSQGTTKIEVTTNKLPTKAIVVVEVRRNEDIATPKIVSGKNHTVALKADGTVWTWGSNANGQLGLGDKTNRIRPTKVDIENVIDISAGDEYTLVLTNDGRVYSFGANGCLQLGRSGDTTVPQVIESLENIAYISAGTNCSMVIDQQGNAYSWGYNYYGQLGNDVTSSRSTSDLSKIRFRNIMKIESNNQSTAMIDYDGNLYVFGYNGYGQFGTGDTKSSSSPICSEMQNIVDIAVAENTFIVLDRDGYVWTSGLNNYGQLGNATKNNRSTFDKVIVGYEDETNNPIYLSNIKSIEAGKNVIVAVDNAGEAYVWGYNGYGQAGNGVATPNLIATKIKHSSDGDVFDNVYDVAVGEADIAIARNDGKVWTIGRNNVGQLGNGGFVDKKQFVCISNSSMRFDKAPIRIQGIGKSDTITANISTGFNLFYNSVENSSYTFESNNKKIATVDENTGVVTSVKKGKTSVVVTENTTGERGLVDVIVLGENDIAIPQIETYNYATVTLKANGEIWSYGNNQYGVLGTGDTEIKKIPTYTGINNIVEIALGNNHTVALDKDGHVWTWGRNNQGQLGNGTKTDSLEKVQVLSPDGKGVLENIISIAAGDSFTLALDKNGCIYSWGYNARGQLGIGNKQAKTLPVKVESVENVIKIEASNLSSFAINNENKLFVAGYNGYGNLGDETTSDKSSFTENTAIKDVADVKASQKDSTIVLLLDGSVWGFGNKSNNALTTAGGAVPTQLETEYGSMENIASIGMGHFTGYAITNEGKVLSWGQNNYAQLANGNKTNVKYATYMKDEDGNDFRDAMIATGGIYYTELAKSDGTVWSIGYNDYGQLGDGSVTSRANLVNISNTNVSIDENEVTLKLSNPTYKVNARKSYEFNLFYDNMENDDFEFTSSDDSVVSVNADTGVATAKKLGRAYITAKSDIDNMTTRVKIDVIGEDKVTKEKIVSGNIHTIALKQNGTIWTWGDNTNGEIGNGSANGVKITSPYEVEVMDENVEKVVFKDISAGNSFNLALDTKGNVYAWGYNGYGQLGDNTKDNKNTPTKIESLSNIAKIYAFDNVSVAIDKDGLIYAWGQGFDKVPEQLNMPHKVLQASRQAILADNGTVWTLEASPNKLEAINNIVEVVSGGNYYAALEGSGKVYVWGYNGYGQLSQNNKTNIQDKQTAKIIVEDELVDLENIVEIAKGGNTLLFLDKSGNLYTAGQNDYGQLGLGNNANTFIATKVENVSDVKNISGGAYHTSISDASGYVYTTGYNGYGELGDGSVDDRNTLESIGGTYVAVDKYSVAVEVNGIETIRATLNNEFNLIQDELDIDNITYESLNEKIATVENNGTIHGKELGKAEIVATHTITGKTAIIYVRVVPQDRMAVPEVINSNDHSVALKADGTVWTWGTNDKGQFGNGTNDNMPSPIEVSNLNNVIDVSAGNKYTLAVKADGTVWAFGYNRYGNLGDGTASDRSTPVQVIKASGEVLSNVVKVYAGNYVSMAIDKDGAVWSWGKGYDKTAKKLDGVSCVIDISENYAVTKDGKVISISDNVELELQNIIRVSEGTNHALFLAKDGKGYGVGGNTKGQLGIATKKDIDTPQSIKDEDGVYALQNIKELSAGNEFSMALLYDGTMYVWGSNDNYTLANTQAINQLVPLKINDVNESLGINAGTQNGSYIDTNGFVYSWGYGEYGQIGNKSYRAVSEPTIVGRADVRLNTNNIVIHKGETFEIIAYNETFNVLREIEDTSEMSYTSSNSAIASVSRSGVVTGIKEGYASVVVNKVGTNFSSIAQITVLPAEVDINPMVLSAGSHTVILKADGSVWSYGLNSSGELGNGTKVSSDRPVRVSFKDGVVIKQIAVGDTHNLALDTDGNVWAWGANTNKAIPSSSSTPYKVGMSNIKKIYAAYNQSMLLTEDGYVYVIGSNENGELGTRTYQNVKEFTMLPDVNDIVDIAMGRNHTLLLTSSGTVLLSGLNVYGQTGKENGKSNTFEVLNTNVMIGYISAGDNHSVLLGTDGKVYTLGYNLNGQLGLGNNQEQSNVTQVADVSNVMKVSAGKNHTMILTADRKIFVSGANTQGQLGIGSQTDKALFTEVTAIDNIMDISAGNTYSNAIDYDGNVWGWGDYYHGVQSISADTNSTLPVKIGNETSYAEEYELVINEGASKAIKITPKYKFNVFEDEEDDVTFSFQSLSTEIATVNNKGVVTGVTTGVTLVKAIENETGDEVVVLVKVIPQSQSYAADVAGGDSFGIVLKGNGSIWGFGYNSDGQLGNDTLVPLNVPSQTNVIETYKNISAGQSFIMTLRADGTVWEWGDNTYGQLGQGNRTSAKKPIQTQDIENVVQIATGANHALALDNTGKLYTWGLNVDGQLGNRGTKTSAVPVRIDGFKNKIISIASAGNLSAVADSAGKVYIFGKANESFKCSVPFEIPNVTDVIRVQCMENKVVVLKSDCTVQVISNITENSCDITTIASNIVDISAKNGAVMAIDKDGNMYTYGDNSKGQAGVGTLGNTVGLSLIDTYSDKKYFAVGVGYKDNYAITTDGLVFAAGDNTYGQLGNESYDDSTEFTLVGKRAFSIIPESRSMEQPEDETVSIEANTFYVFDPITKELTDYNWESSNEEVATVKDGVISSQDMGETTIIATDKFTGEQATALRVVQPLDEQRLLSVVVNRKTAEMIGENKYGVKVVPNSDGTGDIRIETKDSTDKISLDLGDHYQTGVLEDVIDLTENPTLVKIRVLTRNDKIVDYVLVVDLQSQNADLKSLTVDGVETTPIGPTEYEIIVENEITNPIVVAIAEDEMASVSVNGEVKEPKQSTRAVEMITKIKKVVPVIVTAENGDSVEYTLTIYKKDALTELERIKVNDKEAVKINKSTFKAIIPKDDEYAVVYAETLHRLAEVQINNLGQEVHVTTKTVSTLKDQTIVKIYVTAYENEREYTLILDKEGTENILGLFAVSVNGTIIEPADETTYNAYIADNANEVIVDARTVNPEDFVQIEDRDINVGITTETIATTEETTTVTITVSDPEDTENKKEFVLNIKKPSDDDTLKSLTVGNKEFAESAVRIDNTDIYEVSIPDKYETIDVIAVANYELAQVSIENSEFKIVSNQKTINVEDNPHMVSIVVKSQKGTQREYTLRIYRKNSNNNLRKVTVDGNEATAVSGAKDTYEYTLTENKSAVTVGAIAEELSALVAINTFEGEQGASYRDITMESKNVVTYITVTSEDGVDREYKLIIHGVPDNVKLKDVKVDGVSAIPVPTNKYTARVNKSVDKFELYVIADDPKAKVAIEDNEPVYGETSTTIRKDTDEVVVNIRVIAQDGTEEKYKLVVSNKSDNCDLALLAVDNETIIASEEDGKYYVDKKFLTESVEVVAVASDNLATVSINESVPTVQRSEKTVNVPEIENIEIIRVEAEDGSYKDYTLVINKLSNNTNVDIFLITPDDVQTKLEFDSSNEATIKVANFESVDLKAITEDENASVIIDGSIPTKKEYRKEVATIQEKSTVTIEVFAEDGTNSNYVVNLIRYSDDNMLASLVAKDVTGAEITKTSQDSFTIEIPDSINSFDLVARARNEFATISIDDGEYSQESTCTATIDTTNNVVVSVVVRAENGEERPYEVTIVKAMDLGLISVTANGVEAELEDGTYLVFIDSDTDTVNLEITPNNPEVLLSTKLNDNDWSDAEASDVHTLNIDTQDSKDAIVLVNVADANQENKIKNYTIEIREKSHDADLELLRVDGKDAIAREDAYYASVAVDADIARILAKVSSKYADVELENISSDKWVVEDDFTLSDEKSNTINIIVTAQDGVTTNTYTLVIERVSTDTSLSVKVDGKDADEYDDETKTFTAYIDRDAEEVTVSAIAGYELATVELSGDVDTGAVEKTVEVGGEITRLQAYVTAESGDIVAYNIDIVKNSVDFDIEYVKVNGITVEEIDGKYTAIVADTGKDEQTANVEVKANHKKANVRIGSGSEWEEGISNVDVTFRDDNRIIELKIDVNPQDPKTTGISKTLEIDLVSYDNSIKSVKIGEDEVTIYDDATRTYTAFVNGDAEEVVLAIEATSSYATLTSGSLTGTGTLAISNIDMTDEDEVSVDFTVTSESGSEKDYRIIIFKKSNNPNIEHIYIDGTDIIDYFEDVDNVPTYVMSIAKLKDNALIKVETENEYADIHIGDELSDIGISTKRIRLDLNETSITVPIVITSQDGTITKTYNIIFARYPNDTSIRDVLVNGTNIVQNQDGDYEVTVKGSAQNAEVHVILQDEKAKVTLGGREENAEITETVTLPKSDDLIKTITVTAQDGTEAKYKLIIHKNISDLKLKEVTVNDVVATKVDEKNYEIVLTKDVEVADITAVANDESEYVAIGNHERKITEDEYLNCSLEDKKVKIEVASFFEGELDSTEEYTLNIKYLNRITGKVITQAVDQTKQSAKLVVFNTSDTRAEDDEDDPREVVMQADINPDGSYALDLPEGEYDIVVEKAGYLTYRITNVVLTEDVQLDDIKIYAGNLVKETQVKGFKFIEQIEIQDLTAINDKIGVVISDINRAENEIYDLNEDGVVDRLDRNILKKNINKKDQKVVWVNPKNNQSISSYGFIVPIEKSYVITSEYGNRIHPVTNEETFHSGVDMAGEHLGNILAVSDGEVTYAGVQSGYGNCVEIKHTVNGETVYSFYAHLAEIKVKLGDVVGRGTIIGLQGGAATDPNPGTSTGTHLHFEIRSASGSGNSLNPHTYVNL